MGMEKARDEWIRPSQGEDIAEEETPVEDRLDDALLTRLERVVALAGRRRDPALHEELLDELRGLVREAESLRPPPTATDEEVVERPARRLHGT